MEILGEEILGRLKSFTASWNGSSVRAARVIREQHTYPLKLPQTGTPSHYLSNGSAVV
jgi:hypothetical protein